MDLINKNFCKLVDNKFFTENVSLFLYSLIKCSRPQSIIEIGAGYSTLFISESIKDIQQENLNFDILLEEQDQFTGTGYNPIFNVIEDFSHPNNIHNIVETLSKYNLDENVSFIRESIDDYLVNNEEKYDLVWMDFGSGKNYMQYFKLFLEKLNPGGYIVVHSTMTNLAGRLFVAELKLLSNNDLEIISIVEPHKAIQNSFTIIKKVTDYPLYTMLA